MLFEILLIPSFVEIRDTSYKQTGQLTLRTVPLIL